MIFSFYQHLKKSYSSFNSSNNEEDSFISKQHHCACKQMKTNISPKKKVFALFLKFCFPLLYHFSKFELRNGVSQKFENIEKTENFNHISKKYVNPVNFSYKLFFSMLFSLKSFFWIFSMIFSF